MTNKPAEGGPAVSVGGSGPKSANPPKTRAVPGWPPCRSRPRAPARGVCPRKPSARGRARRHLCEGVQQGEPLPHRVAGLAGGVRLLAFFDDLGEVLLGGRGWRGGCGQEA
jgi:hypothetical protein